ncbi:ribonuclease H-like domain-containing protein [Bacillus sp. FJAT-42315]|uniref:ribonuclease H-like domain-containing protein n=1 Tax=Bacillus sp. FJAT-42315 TaxID=2014077 RepID=UPI000C238925|nr:ribonuclease H-like domain-containing protein [Bacillus sp. FJAT-42315]
MSLSNKLKRMKSHIIKEEQTVKVEKEVPTIAGWGDAHVIPYVLGDQHCFIREVSYPLDYQHGRHSFLEIKEAVGAWNDWDGQHPLSAKGMKVNDLFFFDTETTGLGGGVGNTIFLLGYARVLADRVVVRQHFLPAPGNEVALYASFLEQVDYTTLVTYNGKAFDWPQVKTRHTLVRDHVPKLPTFGHFDLFHASRRMWKHTMESVKLANVEKEILGIERQEDVPGFLAPMIYFDYLERRDPEGILKVMEHNEKDILTLITLYTHLSHHILQKNQDSTGRERIEVAKWLGYIGEKGKSTQAYQQIAENDSSVVGLEAKHALAFHYKRKKQWQEAIHLWNEVCENGSDLYKKEAHLELSKYYEHQAKDYPMALTHAQYAAELLAETNEMLSKRLNRIKRKLGN